MKSKTRKQPTKTASRSRSPEYPITEQKLQLLYGIGVALLLLIAFLLACFPITSDDLMMYLAIGRDYFKNGGFSAIDPFLFSIPNYHWEIMHQWLAYLIIYKLFTLGGWNLLLVVKIILVLALASIPIFFAKRIGYRSMLTLLLVVAAAFVASFRFLERTSLISDFLTCLVLSIILIDRKEGGKIKWALPFIFLLWVQLHSGFIFSLVLVGCSIAVDIRRVVKGERNGLIACLVLSVLGCLTNPMGIIYVLKLFFGPSQDVLKQNYFEWMPTLHPHYIGTYEVWGFIGLTVSIGCLLVYALTKKHRLWFEFAAYGLLVWIGFSSIRFVPMSSFAQVVLGIWIAANLHLLEMKHGSDKEAAVKLRSIIPRFSYVIIGLLLILAVKLVIFGYGSMSYPRKLGMGLDYRFYPEGAARFIDTIALKTNLFNQHQFGVYLAWRWDGSRKLYYHGFVTDSEFYEHQYLAVNKSRADFYRIVKEYNLGAFLLQRQKASPDHMPLIFKILTTEPDWHLVYMDHLSILFLRDMPENKKALEKFGKKPLLQVSP